MPWWDPAEIPAAALLEDNYLAIRNEFLNVLICGQLRLHPQSRGGPGKQLTDGDWNIFDLYSRGCVNAANAIFAPHTIRILRQLPEVTTNPSGFAYFSVLNPGVHISPHCGPTNSRIRVHLGLRVPKGAALRVGRETRGWKEGICSVFDDSWEHEVFNKSDFLRAVLILDVWHPDLSIAQQSRLAARQSSSESFVERSKRRRKGWVDRSHLAEAFAGPSLHSLVGSKHLARMIASATKASDSPLQIFSTLRAFASDSMDTTGAKALVRRSGPEAAACRGLWAGLAALASEIPNGFSLEDAVNVIHVGCAYWRSWPGNQRLLWKFMQAHAAEPGTLLSDMPKRPNGVHELLQWCDAHGEASAPFGALAAAAVVALREISAKPLPRSNRTTTR
jgi:aspartyl/asparaginyl beta-hydroxylase (cupin superfamily)